ncbi:MAG: MMPL family transporter [Planctomycetaceae bacterium]|nr:MMPL family transporter [Planctomycetaceae bacterium]
MKFLTRICIERPWQGWLLVVLLSVPPLLGFAGLRLTPPAPAGWVPERVLEELREQQRLFGANTPVVLVLTSDNFFLPERVAALHQTAAELRAAPNVESLSWAGDIPEVTVLTRRRRMLLPAATDATADSLIAARAELLQQPLVAGNLMSADGNTLLMLLDVREANTGQVARQTLEQVRKIAGQHLDPVGISSRLTGTLPLYETQSRALAEDNSRIQWMAYAIVGALLLLIFRRPVAIVLAGSGPVTGVVWALGWLRLFGQANNELAKIILPVMIMMIGFTDGVHLVLRFRQLRADGQSVDDALRVSLHHTGPACFLTSLTTAVGFGSLVFSQSEMISGFGLSAAVAVIVTFLAVVLVSSLLTVSRLGHWMYIPPGGESVSKFVSRFAGVAEFSSRHARTVSLGGIVLTAAGLVACAQLIPDDRVSDRIPQQSEAWQAMRHCDEHVNGIRSVHLLMEWAPDTSREEIWSAVRDCEQILRRESRLSTPVSIRTALTVIRGRHRPDQSILARQLPEEFRTRFYRPDERMAFVTARAQDLGFASFDAMFDRLSAALQERNATSDAINIRLVSNVILEGRVVGRMIEEMLFSLAGAAVIIFVILTVAFRSVRIGLISIIPNVMPLVIAGGLKYFLDGSIGIAGTCSVAICLGIAVDDTIHFLTHFRHERQTGTDVLTASRRTFVAVGSALFLTTVVMTAGLATVLTSQMPPQVSFASMALVTLLAALPADLLFLPSLLTLFASSETFARPRVSADHSTEASRSAAAINAHHSSGETMAENLS